MRALAGLLLAGLVAGFAAGTARAIPPGPPPSVPGVRSKPPPAWIETKLGDRWLGHSSYCWETTCADFVPPTCAQTRVPKIAVSRRERVRFHLGFRPRRLELRLPSGRTVRLAAARVSAWTVTGRGGVIALFAKASKGDASYVACFRLR